MKPRLKSTSAARDLIKRFEPFLTVAERGADGRFVVGYGHRASARENGVVDSDDADLLLIYDVLQAEKAIDETIGAELGDPQRDALISFALGVGLGAFRQSATVRLIAKNRWRDAADAIAAWGGGQSPRRAAERELFLKDLPDDADLRPVELIIEVEHPALETGDDAILLTDLSDDVADAGESEADAEAEAEAVQPVMAQVDESDDVDDEADIAVEPVEGDDADAIAADDDGEEIPETLYMPSPLMPTASEQSPDQGPAKDSVQSDDAAARVIARMREQIAPRRTVDTIVIDESNEVPGDVALDIKTGGPTELEAPEDVEAEAKSGPDVEADAAGEVVEVEADIDAVSAPLDPTQAVGFMFTSDSVSEPDAEPATVEPAEEVIAEPASPIEAANDADEAKPDDDRVAAETIAPPKVTGAAPAAAMGAIGEANGSERIPVEVEADDNVSDEDLPDPDEIDPSLKAAPKPEKTQAWENGDSSAAPSSTSGGWGVLIVLALGMVVMVAGLWDTMMQIDHYLDTRSLFIGPAVALAGFILVAGASIMLLGRLFKKSS
jgi:GH24 family phage-related lysozyme (muramidase)